MNNHSPDPAHPARACAVLSAPRSNPCASARPARMGRSARRAYRIVDHTEPEQTAPDQREHLDKRKGLKPRDLLRAVVSTDTEFFNSRYCQSGKWAGCWLTSWRSAVSRASGKLPAQNHYFTLFRLKGLSFSPVTDETCKSLSQLLPPATRSVWLTVVSQAVAQSWHRSRDLFEFRISYKNVFEALIQRKYSHPVPPEWIRFIDQQLDYLASIFYRQIAITCQGTARPRVIQIEQPAPLPLVAVKRQSDKPQEFSICALSPLFWVLFGIGRVRVLPCSVRFPRELWRFCACTDLLARISVTPINGSAKVRDLFNSCSNYSVVRDQFARSRANRNISQESDALAQSVRDLLESLEALGALEWTEPRPQLFKWIRHDHGKTLSDRGLFAEALARASESVAEGNLWGGSSAESAKKPRSFND